MNVKDNDLVNQVVASYKVPSHLTNVMIVIQSLKSANKGLVFKGQDSKLRWQYFYGRDYTAKRSESRLDTLERVDKIWLQLMERMNILLDAKVGSLDLQIGFILFFLSKTFIRTGKHIHYKQNNTQGLITLRKENILFDTKYNIRIRFIGKDKVKHDISVRASKEIYNKFKAQVEWAKDFIFTYEKDDRVEIIKEFVIYDFLDEFNIRPKDIRTYGANILFLEAYLRLMNNEDLTNMNKSSYKKIISKAVEDAAARIGHTKNISKRSYISQQIFSFLEALYDKIDDINTLKLLKKTPVELLQFLIKSV